MDKCPTLTELMSFGKKSVDIIEGIGDRYHRFGTKLLKDDTGSKMGVIENDERNKAEAINEKVLTRWIRGEGREPRSWDTLATVLDECKLTELAKQIRSEKAPAAGKCPTLHVLVPIMLVSQDTVVPCYLDM